MPGTGVYGYLTPVTDGVTLLANTDVEKISKGLEEGRIWGDGEYIGPGFYYATDFNGTQIAGILGLTISLGRCFAGNAGALKLINSLGNQNIQNGLVQGGIGGTVVVVASVVNWWFLNSDGTFTVNTTGTNPGNGAQLCCTALMAATQSSSIDNNPPGRLQSFRRAYSYGRQNTGHIRIAVNPTDTDIVTIKVGDLQQIFEYDNNSSVTAGRILVTIGGTAAITATNLAAAINANMAAHVTAAVHATDTTIVDLIVKGRGQLFATLTESSAGARTVVRDNAEGLIAQERQIYGIRRAVVAEDVTRTRIRVNTGLTTIAHYHYRLLTSAASNVEIGYTGTITVTGGVIEFAAGGTNFAAGNILDLLIIGS